MDRGGEEVGSLFVRSLRPALSFLISSDTACPAAAYCGTGTCALVCTRTAERVLIAEPFSHFPFILRRYPDACFTERIPANRLQSISFLPGLSRCGRRFFVVTENHETWISSAGLRHLFRNHGGCAGRIAYRKNGELHHQGKRRGTSSRTTPAPVSCGKLVSCAPVRNTF